MNGNAYVDQSSIACSDIIYKKLQKLLRFFSSGTIRCLNFYAVFILVAYKRLLIKNTACNVFQGSMFLFFLNNLRLECS